MSFMDNLEESQKNKLRKFVEDVLDDLFTNQYEEALLENRNVGKVTGTIDHKNDEIIIKIIPTFRSRF